MHTDKFLFLLASLDAIGIIILIRLADYIVYLAGYMIYRVKLLIITILFGVWVTLLSLLAYDSFYIETSLISSFNGPRFGDGSLAVLGGAAFGTLTARFVWRLFGPNFRIMEAVLGASVFVLLTIAYSLPLYKQAILGVFDRIGIASIKTPVAEFTLERPTRRPVLNTGSQAQAGTSVGYQRSPSA